MAWKWLSSITRALSRPSAIERAFLTQQRLLEQIVSKQQATIEAQQQTIDRVVALHYDRPIGIVADPKPNEPIPAFAMSDQSDVRPGGGAPDSVAECLSRLHVESDREFLGG